MLKFYTKKERFIVVLLCAVFIYANVSLYKRFIKENSTVIPAEGGIYTEGLVGKPISLNPLYSHRNPIDRDINNLIFAGLTKYNPQTGNIEDDIATSERSDNNLVYTFTLLPNLKWHDGLPVTSEDVMFTYQNIIQSETFNSHFLNETFRDIKITKKDNRTVTFTLKEPYSFFLSNVTIGLLPKHILELEPIDSLDISQFNLEPIGIGPYKFKSWIQNEETTEITLSRNKNYHGTIPKIETLIARIFPTPEARDLAKSTLNGFKINTEQKLQFQEAERFNILSYQLPQYVALFLNTESPFLANRKTRFGLLLATNKEEIASELGNVTIVDTPVLESKTGLDIEYNQQRANGAFFDTDWFLPSKMKTEESLVKETSTNKEDQEVKQEAPILEFNITAKKDSWISPEIDGKKGDGFILKAGEQKEITAKEDLHFISIGNAGGITVSVNNIRLQPLGEDGDVVENLKLNKETITEYITEKQLPLFLKSIGEKSSEETVNTPETKTEEEKTEEATEDPIRINKKGERLSLKLITTQNPETYLQTAEIIQRQWKKAGVKLIVETYPLVELQQKISERDYDILLFGQNLGYNLDAYPFWHSSQAENGFNLAQHKDIATDSLLVEIRETFDFQKKQSALDNLKKNIAKQTPAIFLYNPFQYVALDKRVKNINLNKLATDADRFSDILNWYIKEHNKLYKPFSVQNFISWIKGTAKNTENK